MSDKVKPEPSVEMRERASGEHTLLQLAEEFVRMIEDNWEIPEETVVFEGVTSDWLFAWLKSFKREIARGQAGAASQGEGWVSVEDRLPEDYQVVLVHHIIESGGTLTPKGRFVWFAKLVDGVWKRSDNLNLDNVFPFATNVTHWRPLPAAPGKEGER